jgi:Major Facilitator Superfamily
MQEIQTNTTNKEKFFTKPLAIIYLTVFIDLVGFGIVIPALPYYVESEAFRATPFEIGILFASYSLMQFIFAPILGGLSDRYGRRPVLFFSIIGSAIGYLFIGFSSALWMVFAGRIIAGITGGNISTAQAYIADVTTKENRAKGMGLFGAVTESTRRFCSPPRFPLSTPYWFISFCPKRSTKKPTNHRTLDKAASSSFSRRCVTPNSARSTRSISFS